MTLIKRKLMGNFETLKTYERGKDELGLDETFFYGRTIKNILNF